MHWYLPRVSNAHLLGNIDNDHAYQQNLFYSIQDVKLWHPESRTGSMYRFEWEDIAWNNHVIAFTLRMNMQHFSFDWTPAKNWWATCIDWDQLELSDDLRDHEQQSERLRGHLHTIQHCIVTNSIQGCLGYTCVSFIELELASEGFTKEYCIRSIVNNAMPFHSERPRVGCRVVKILLMRL